jgi:hypothetical protein
MCSSMRRGCALALLISALAAGIAGALTYRPKSTARLWDTWLYYRDGTYYLYYLVTETSPGERIDLATSQDGVHWTEVGTVLHKADDAVWIGSGSVWESTRFAQDGKFIMNFSEWRGKGQNIFFAESTDLVHWSRLGKEIEFSPDTRYYQAPPKPSRWDCIYTIPKDGGGLYGFWTATPIGRPGFGFGQSQDGLHWTAMPSPVIHWRKEPEIKGLEIGAVEPIHGTYYALLGAYNYPQIGDLGGMYVAKASAVGGPYTVDEAAYRVLTTQAHRDTYFARFFRSPDGLLINHQFIRRDGEAYFAPLKRAVVDKQGHLRIRYWEGNERLKGKAVAIDTTATGMVPGWTVEGSTIRAKQGSGSSAAVLKNKFDLKKGIVLEGKIFVSAGEPFSGAGFFIEETNGLGTGIMAQTNEVTEFGIYEKSRLGYRFVVDDSVNIGLAPAKEHTFRLLLRRDLMELYLDHQLVQCYSLPVASYSGRLGFLAANGEAKFREIHAWEMTLPGD